MNKQRELVIRAGAEQTDDPSAGFQRFVEFAENGGVYMKLGRGEPGYARPGCRA